MGVMAGRADGLFDPASRNARMNAAGRDLVDRVRVIELRGASGDVSERCRGRKQIGAKRDGLGH